MDKQKQIEEMAKVLKGFCCLISGEPTKGGCELCKRSYASCFHYAEHIYNAGYRKIPKDSVVFTGTETEERIEDLLIEFDEMSFYPATLHPNAEEYVREWKSKLIYAIGQLRKETAEKFAERLKISLDTHDLYVISNEDIDEICKEITEGANGV